MVFQILIYIKYNYMYFLLSFLPSYPSHTSPFCLNRFQTSISSGFFITCEFNGDHKLNIAKKELGVFP